MISPDIGPITLNISLGSFLYDLRSFHHYFNTRYRGTVLLRLKYLLLLVITIWLVLISKSEYLLC